MDTSSAEPVVHFHQPGSHGGVVDDTAFTGKVPVVVTFALVPDVEQRATLIQGLDASLHEFGERRVQLLVAVDGDPVAMAAGLDVKVTLMADNGLAERLGAMPDEEGRIATMLLDNRGRAVHTLRQCRWAIMRWPYSLHWRRCALIFPINLRYFRMVPPTDPIHDRM